MEINGINISEYKCKLMSRTINSPEYDYISNWGKNFPDYFFAINGGDKFRRINLKLDCICKDANELEQMKNQLIEELKKCKIKFPDIDYYYRGFLSALPTYTYVMKGNETIEIEIWGVAEGDEVIETIPIGTTSYTLSAAGTKETSCILLITPSVDIGNITITINDDSYYIETLTTNNTIQIHGTKGTVTENGINIFDRVDLWTLPKLNNGNNIISIDNSNVEIKIIYNPRY